jgi:hypothetical protein
MEYSKNGDLLRYVQTNKQIINDVRLFAGAFFVAQLDQKLNTFQ